MRESRFQRKADRIKLLRPAHAKAHGIPTNTLETEALDLLLDSLESVSPTSEQE